MLKMCNRPPLSQIIYRFALQPPPPRWNFPAGATGAGGAEAGGAGAGGAGAGGSGSAGKVSAGIPDHSLKASWPLSKS